MCPQATPVVYKPFISETAALEETFSKMAVGMWHFSKFVPNAVVQGIIKDASVGSNGLGMAWQTVTVMFTDVKGFTGISENTPVDALVSKLQVYFGLLTSVIVAHEGTVDKYIGDGCMAFWNHPEPIENHQVQGRVLVCGTQRRPAGPRCRANGHVARNASCSTGNLNWFFLQDLCQAAKNHKNLFLRFFSGANTTFGQIQFCGKHYVIVISISLTNKHLFFAILSAEHIT